MANKNKFSFFFYEVLKVVYYMNFGPLLEYKTVDLNGWHFPSLMKCLTVLVCIANVRFLINSRGWLVF